MPQKKYDLRNKYGEITRRYNNEEERMARLQVVVDAHNKQVAMPKKHAESEVLMSEKIFSIGESVRIARGPLKGFEGELCYVTDNKPMVAIRIECLGYACVNVSKADIESVNNKNFHN